MRILIIEDKPQHILSAEKFAGECGHDVVIAKSYEEAEVILNLGHDGPTGWKNKDKILQKFDVVLTDLMLPAALYGLGSNELKAKFQVTQQPYGLIFILVALRHGVKAIGLLSDGNHHEHPMVWGMDLVDNVPIRIGDTVILSNTYSGSYYSHYNKPDSPEYVPEGDPLDGAKDWMEFWLMLMSHRSPIEPL